MYFFLPVVVRIIAYVYSGCKYTTLYDCIVKLCNVQVLFLF